MKISYDYDVDPTGDPLIHKVEDSMSVLAQIMIPGNFLVESYPFRESIFPTPSVLQAYMCTLISNRVCHRLSSLASACSRPPA